MKRIAIIPPGNLPIPALGGGAVEGLTTYIMKKMKKQKLVILQFLIDITRIINSSKCTWRSLMFVSINIIRLIKYMIKSAWRCVSYQDILFLIPQHI